MIELWLAERPATTKRSYRSDIEKLRKFASGRELADLTLADLQRFAASLVEKKYATATRARIVSSVKSYYRFCYRERLHDHDIANALRVQSVHETLAERILSEDAAKRLVSALDDNERNAALLRFLYGTGARVSEAAALKWRDLAARGDSGQVTLHGKRNKTRHILLHRNIWQRINALPRTEERVFGVSACQIWRIVKQAAAAAGLPADVSPHWLRHAHASHALERGATIELVRATLGHASIATTSRYLHARPSESSSLFLMLEEE